MLLAAVILAPILWLFIMSIAPAADLAAKPLRWWPQAVDFSRYQVLLSAIWGTQRLTPIDPGLNNKFVLVRSEDIR